MNTYLFPWSSDIECSITKIVARNFQDCEDRIKDIYLNKYDDLNDLLDFEEFCEELCDKHGIFVGNIFEIDEFM